LPIKNSVYFALPESEKGQIRPLVLKAQQMKLNPNARLNFTSYSKNPQIHASF